MGELLEKINLKVPKNVLLTRTNISVPVLLASQQTIDVLQLNLKLVDVSQAGNKLVPEILDVVVVENTLRGSSQLRTVHNKYSNFNSAEIVQLRRPPQRRLQR